MIQDVTSLRIHNTKCDHLSTTFTAHVEVR